MKGILRTIKLTLLAIMTVAVCVEAADLKGSALNTVSKFQKAFVTVKVLSKLKAQQKEDEQRSEVLGTVIDPSGLTVVSAASIDPAAAWISMMSSFARKELPSEYKMESEVTQISLIMDDGTEIESEVLLKDADLDLAFVCPRATKKEFVSVSLKDRGRAADLLEDIFVVSRLGRSENRAISLSTGKIQSVVKGPRLFYVLDQTLSANGLGCVAFDADGNPVGLFVTKQNRNSDGGSMGAMMGMMMGKTGQAGTLVILRPIEDVSQVATQALQIHQEQTQTQTQE